jgi:hypothetical protein
MINNLDRGGFILNPREYAFSHFVSVEQLPTPLKRLVANSEVALEKKLMLDFGNTETLKYQDKIDRAKRIFLDNAENMQSNMVKWEEKLLEARDPDVTEKEIVDKFSDDMYDYIVGIVPELNNRREN